jgi:hypothetical protein
MGGVVLWRTLVGVGAGLLVVVGGAVAVAAISDRAPVEPPLGFVALGAVIAGPGLVALIGFRARPAVWLPAGLAALLLALTSALGYVSLLPAGIVFAVAWARTPAAMARPAVHPAVLTAMVLFPLLIAGVALFSSGDPSSWRTPAGGGEVGNVITALEALVSLANLAGALVISWLLGGRSNLTSEEDQWA